MGTTAILTGTGNTKRAQKHVDEKSPIFFERASDIFGGFLD
jgi:hypothetical protein